MYNYKNRPLTRPRSPTPSRGLSLYKKKNFMWVMKKNYNNYHPFMLVIIIKEKKIMLSYDYKNRHQQDPGKKKTDIHVGYL